MITNRDVWTVIFKAATNDDNFRVVDCSFVRSGLYLYTNKKMAPELFGMFGANVKVERHSSKNWCYQIKKVEQEFLWAMLRIASNVLISRSDFDGLRKIALEAIENQFDELMDSLKELMSINANYDNIRLTDTSIVFNRHLLWTTSDEERVEVMVVPGLSYLYDPQKKITSLTVSFSCIYLWNWILEIKYLSPTELLNVPGFKTTIGTLGDGTFSLSSKPSQKSVQPIARRLLRC